MKYTLILSLLFCFVCKGQKDKKYTNVSTVDVYDNGEIIRYKDKSGKQIIDTVYFDKQKTDISIYRAELVNIREGKLPRKKIRKH